jgi:hypothetical protein
MQEESKVQVPFPDTESAHSVGDAIFELLNAQNKEEEEVVPVDTVLIEEEEEEEEDDDSIDLDVMIYAQLDYLARESREQQSLIREEMRSYMEQIYRMGELLLTLLVIILFFVMNPIPKDGFRHFMNVIGILFATFFNPHGTASRCSSVIWLH